LKPVQHEDVAINGLQVPGRPAVETVVTGVSANLELVDRAVEAGADLVVVHHGLFLRDTPGLDETLARRLRPLLEHGISLACYHLPLDAHLEVGNSALLARELGAYELTRFTPYGVGGQLDPLPPAELVARVHAVTGREPL